MKRMQLISLGAVGGLLCGLPLASAQAWHQQDGGLDAIELVAEDELMHASGRQNSNLVQVGDLRSNANLTDNSAIGTLSGDNSIASGALHGAAGLVTVIQNSGNNVVIQDSTVLNVNVK
ncbi:hypothetical protein CAI21_00180 [Alkalilimnicola ehrlichii]|uniref:Uncharacterized protein n=1 Tax=Alkalilimnicola ehrlichii TaxID=351052 RepID=A0A3E0X4I2_9GAMM|nr:hypothetical protein [Alkalilimnicola ehrlichii]RFA31120.1 hypothetical protein CAI21_00180 [Alkalilimnicola ehrlichii]RFA39595.1 hypothetical protein CAL65_02225 [Alkalilimnicola ehrlichii]